MKTSKSYLAVILALFATGAAPIAVACHLPPTHPLVFDGDYSHEDHSGHDHSEQLLWDANFTSACFTGADLSYSVFNKVLHFPPFPPVTYAANFTDADLEGADLRNPNRASAITDVQLQSAAGVRYVNLSGNDLSYFDLNGLNLSYANLSSADLTFANLRFATLRNSDRAEAITDAQLRSAADVRDVNLFENDMNNFDLSGLDLSGAQIRSAQLIAANLSSTNLGSANLEYTQLVAADLHAADLSSARLANAILFGADLNGADSSEADLRFANLSNPNRGEAITDVQLQSAATDIRGVILALNDMSNFDLSWLYLAYANVSNANLSNTNLTNTNLYSANLSSTNCTLANLHYATLRGADLSFADLSAADLSFANLRDANLLAADLRSANLSAADLPWADLSSADLFLADLTSADLYNANLTSANLSNANLLAADLSNWNRAEAITDVQLRSAADVRLVDLNGNDMNNFDLSGLDLSDANLSDANLSNANLSNANLGNANFSNANLTSAALPHATLAGADLTDAEVRGAWFHNTTSWGFSAAQLYSTSSFKAGDLTGIWLSQNDLTGWNFFGRNLTTTNFSDANLTNANLTYTNLTGALLINATLTGADLAHANLHLAGLPSAMPMLPVVDTAEVRVIDPLAVGPGTTVVDRGGLLRVYNADGDPDIASLVTPSLAVAGRVSVETDGVLLVGSGSPTGLPLGSYTQQTGKTLTVTLAGTSQGEFGVVDVFGTATLGGTLDLVPVLPYGDPTQPGELDAFVMLLSGNVAETFDEIMYDGVVLEDTLASPTIFGSHQGDGFFRILEYESDSVTFFNYKALPGDANGDLVVDRSDFNIWNANKFTAGTDWTTGDFNGDGTTDGSDFNIWNANKFTQVAGTAAVPEPTWLTWFVVAIVSLIARRSCCPR